MSTEQLSTTYTDQLKAFLTRMTDNGFSNVPESFSLWNNETSSTTKLVTYVCPTSHKTVHEVISNSFLSELDDYTYIRSELVTELDQLSQRGYRQNDITINLRSVKYKTMMFMGNILLMSDIEVTLKSGKLLLFKNYGQLKAYFDNWTAKASILHMSECFIEELNKQDYIDHLNNNEN